MTAPNSSGSTGLAGLSYQELKGRTVLGSDGSKIGKNADLHDDESGGAPIFATVHTGLFGTKATFVPMTQAELQGDDVVVPFDKETVKGAPNVQADEDVSPQEEQEIFSYYGLTGSSSGSQGSSGAQGSTGNAGAAGTAGYAAGGQETAGRQSADTGHATEGHDTSGPTT